MLTDQIRTFNACFEQEPLLHIYSRARFFFSFLCCAARYGSSANDFFRYRFYEKSALERKKFITYRKSQYLIRHFNDPADRNTFRNKSAFNKAYFSFLKRRWIHLSGSSFAEFEKFVLSGGGNFIAKPFDGGRGSGITKFTKEDNLRELYDKLQNHIIEEWIEQHPAMASLNPCSVNTVRILTFLDNDLKPHIIGCSLRMGRKNSIVDNLHASGSGGVACAIDPVSGIVISKGYGRDRNEYICHPDTHTQLVGFKIPLWDKVIDTVSRAAVHSPRVRYVGWDIAITQVDVELIEGNHDPSHDLIQMLDNKGKWEEITRLIHS